MDTTMTRAEREAFLADVHVGVLSIAEPGHGPLAAPIWYGYEPGGEIWLVTGRDSRRAGCCGPACASRSSCRRSRRPTATSAARAATPTSRHRGPPRQRAQRARPHRPERWLTVDYRKAFA